MSGTINEDSLKNIKTDKSLQSAQRLRLIRLGMAFITYIVVVVAALLITKLGFGQMTITVWIIFISIGLVGNIIFFMIIHTNTNTSFSDPSLTREQIIYSTFWGLIPLYFLYDARHIVLMFYLPAFSFGMLRLSRKQYFSVVAVAMGSYAFILAMEIMQHRQGFFLKYELFLFITYGILLSWFAFFGGFVSNLRRRLSEQNKKLHKALSEVKTLSGFLPICASCKKIRDDKGYWNQIEAYIRDHSEAEFSHSICPECAKKIYPEFYKNGVKDKE